MAHRMNKKMRRVWEPLKTAAVQVASADGAAPSAGYVQAEAAGTRAVANEAKARHNTLATAIAAVV